MSYYQGGGNRNQGQAMQAAADGLQYNLLNIDPNRPPHVPPIQPYARALNGWVPYVAGRCAILIQEQAQANPLRIYMFNMCAYNNFANEFFDSVVISAVDLAGWLVETQRFSVEEAVEVAAEDIVDMVTAANCRDFPDLWNFMDQSADAAINETIRKYDQVGRDIGAWKNPRGGNSGGGRSGGTYSAPNGRSRAASYSGGVTSGSERSGTYSQSRAPARNQSRAEAQRGEQGGGRANNWGDGARRSQGRPQQEVQDVEVREEVAQPVMKEIPATIAAWKPSKQYPYFLAFDMNAQIGTFEPQADNSMRPVITAKSQEEMDYASHATPNAFGKAPAYLDLSNSARTIANVRAGIARINKQADLPPPEAGKPSGRTAISDKWVMESSEAAAWLMANLRRQKDDVGDDRAAAFRVYGVVVESALTLEDENPIVEQFANAKGGWLGLKGLLETLGANASLELMNIINRRLTDAVNRKLRLEMGLKLSMDSFREDIEDVIRILDQKYGFKSQFLANQQADIARVLRPLKPEVLSSFVDGLIHGMDFNGERPHVAAVSSNYSMTFLDCNIWEVSVQIGEKGMPARVTKELTPEFYEMVKGAYDDAAGFHLEGSDETSIARVLFRTVDGSVLEASRGALVPDAYLLTLVG